MAHEYYFMVAVDDDKGVPFGPVNKDNMDISRLLIDFTCWLDVNESITELSHMTIMPNPAMSLPTWQADYPLCNMYSYSTGVDTYPLDFVKQAVFQSGKIVALDVAAGTPTMSYVVSFTALAGVSKRRRLVDILMVIDRPLNPALVGLSDDTPVVFPLYVNTSTLLPYGFTGSVYVENTSGGAITITLPPSPTPGDKITIKDIVGNATAYNITINTPDGSLIDDTATYVIAFGFGNLGVEWTGTRWSIM